MVPNSSFGVGEDEPRDSAARGARTRRRASVEVAKLLEELAAHQLGGLGVGERHVVAGLGLGRGREDAARAAARPAAGRTASPGRTPCPAPRTRSTPSRTGSRARCTPAAPVGSPARASPAPRRRAPRSRGSRWGPRRSGGWARGRRSRSNQNVDSAVSTRPLSGIEVGEHDVEHRDPVRRHDQHAVVVDLVEVADLPGVRGAAARCPSRTRRRARRGRRTRGRRGRGRGLRSKQAARRRGRERGERPRGPRRARRGTGGAPPTCASRCAARSGRRRRACSPASTSASSTGWLNTSPYDASRFSSMRSGYTRIPSTIFRNFTSR